MRKLAGVLWTVLAGLVIIAPGAVAQGTQSPEDQVRAVAHAFSDALSRADSTGALALLHEDVLILEGQRAETKTQYRSGHLAADIRYLSTVKSERLREGVTITGEAALYTRQSRITGTSARGAAIDRTSTEAMSLVRTPDGWRIRSIHWF
jgi:ketosteroid isomerase-like protein